MQIAKGEYDYRSINVRHRATPVSPTAPTLLQSFSSTMCGVLKYMDDANGVGK